MSEMHLFTCIPPNADGTGGRCLCKLAPMGLLGRLLGDILAGRRDLDNPRAINAMVDLVEYVSNLRAQCGVSPTDPAP